MPSSLAISRNAVAGPRDSSQIRQLNRRRFLQRVGGTAGWGFAAGVATPWPGLFDISPAAADTVIKGKSGLIVLSDRPVGAETPPHLLDDEVTPTERHFVRNNGLLPDDLNPESWTLKIEGLVDRPSVFSIADLQNQFEVVTRRLVIECAGNGRAWFQPQVPGQQWTYGAVACAEWTGVRLADLLRNCGIRKEAVYTAHESADTHLSGEPGRLPLSRGVPAAKAMDPGNLVAFAMNGRPLHPMNGAPLRLVIPGWPGSCSQKWLTRIRLIDHVHDGAKMTGRSYRMPANPIAPGEDVPDEEMRIIHTMPVKSLITAPATGAHLADRRLTVSGHAWAGERQVSQVNTSIDYGASWQRAELRNPHNPNAWQRWTADLVFPSPGHFEIWARATDEAGFSQPLAVAWNPNGYLNNSVHRIFVRITA